MRNPLHVSAKNLIAIQASELSRFAMTGSVPIAEVMKEIQRKMVYSAMVYFNGNQTHAARMLRVHRNTFSRMLDQCKLSSRIGRNRKRSVFRAVPTGAER